MPKPNLKNNPILNQLRANLKKQLVTRPSEIIKDFDIADLGVTPLLDYLDTPDKIAERVGSLNYTKEQVRSFMRTVRDVGANYQEIARVQNLSGFNTSSILRNTRARFENLMTTYRDTDYVFTQRLKNINKEIEKLTDFQTQYDTKLVSSKLLFREADAELKQKYVDTLKNQQKGEVAYKESWTKLYNSLGIPKNKRVI